MRHVVAYASQAPEGLPTINAGKPWSEMDIADTLSALLREPVTIRHIAEFLRQDVAEVEAKITELRRWAAHRRPGLKRGNGLSW